MEIEIKYNRPSKNKILLINKESKELILITSESSEAGVGMNGEIFIKLPEEIFKLNYYQSNDKTKKYDVVIGQIFLDECNGYEKISEAFPEALVIDKESNTVQLHHDHESDIICNYYKNNNNNKE